jgi:hypothetical protein
MRSQVLYRAVQRLKGIYFNFSPPHRSSCCLEAVYIAAAEVVYKFVVLTTVYLTLPNTNFTEELWLMHSHANFTEET